MEKKRGRLIEVVGSVAAAAVVVLYLWVIVNQPVPAAIQNPSSPGATTPAPTTDQTNVPQSNAPGGNSPSGSKEIPPGNAPQTPPPPALGNGHKVPKGWANADCPSNGKGKGVQARCDDSATYGALRKAGLAGTLIDNPNSHGESQSAQAHVRAEARASEDGSPVATSHNSGHHYGQT